MLVGLASGVVGVWASFQRNTFAAKLFLWSWPANFAISMISWIIWWLAMEQLTNYGLSASQLMPTTCMFFVSSINLYFLVYFTKVLRPYKCICFGGGAPVGDLYAFPFSVSRRFPSDRKYRMQENKSSTSLMVGVPRFHGILTFDHVVSIGILVILCVAEDKGYECIVQQCQWRRAPWTPKR